MKEEKSPRFVVFSDKDGSWRWHLRARNGEITAQGEGFTSRTDANRSVAAVKRDVKKIAERDQ